MCMWRSEDNFWELVLSFIPVDSGNWTQADKFGDQCLLPWAILLALIIFDNKLFLSVSKLLPVLILGGYFFSSLIILLEPSGFCQRHCQELSLPLTLTWTALLPTSMLTYVLLYAVRRSPISITFIFLILEWMLDIFRCLSCASAVMDDRLSKRFPFRVSGMWGS